MKKEYSSPELDKVTFSFESILQSNAGIDVSKNESGGSDHIDDDNDDW